jgi:hypothetical protein
VFALPIILIFVGEVTPSILDWLTQLLRNLKNGPKVSNMVGDGD